MSPMCHEAVPAGVTGSSALHVHCCPHSQLPEEEASFLSFCRRDCLLMGGFSSILARPQDTNASQLPPSAADEGVLGVDIRALLCYWQYHLQGRYRHILCSGLAVLLLRASVSASKNTC